MTAFVFPGQGAQFSGMGKDLYDSYPLARSIMLRANEILGFSITDVMFEGSDEDLRQTRVTQPAIFLHSIVSCQLSTILRPDMVAGHSLGEFSALVVAGAIGWEDGLRLVSQRAQAMQEACEIAPGTMAAVLGMPDDKVTEICQQVSSNANSQSPPIANSQLPIANYTNEIYARDSSPLYLAATPMGRYATSNDR